MGINTWNWYFSHGWNMNTWLKAFDFVQRFLSLRQVVRLYLIGNFIFSLSKSNASSCMTVSWVIKHKSNVNTIIINLILIQATLNLMLIPTNNFIICYYFHWNPRFFIICYQHLTQKEFGIGFYWVILHCKHSDKTKT